MILVRVRRCVEGDKCVMGARNQEECAFSLRDLEEGILCIVPGWTSVICSQRI
jgi:hypothetical protein